MHEEPLKKEKNVLEETISSIDREIDETFGHDADVGFDSNAAKLNEEQHIVFTLAGTEYAVSVFNVREVGKLLKVTAVPNLPHWVYGISNLRGEIISILDFRALLGIESIPYQDSKRMLVSHSRERDITTALVVDDVRGIRCLSMDKVNSSAPVNDKAGKYMQGIYEDGNSLLTLIDLERLLVSPKIRHFNAHTQSTIA